MTGAKEAATAAVEEAEADEGAKRRLGELLAPFHGSGLVGILEAEEEGEGEGGGVLSDPLPLYVYRTR
jgi:hypothetical protein